MKLYNLFTVATTIVVAIATALPVQAQNTGGWLVSKDSLMDSYSVELQTFPYEGLSSLHVQYASTHPNAVLRIKKACRGLRWSFVFRLWNYKNTPSDSAQGHLSLRLIHGDTTAATVAGPILESGGNWYQFTGPTPYTPQLSSIDTIEIEFTFFDGDSGSMDLNIDLLQREDETLDQFEAPPVFYRSPDGLSYTPPLAVGSGTSICDYPLVKNMGSGLPLTVTNVWSSSPAWHPGITTFTLAPGESLDLPVWFQPYDTGFAQAILYFEHNGGTSPDSMWLYGLGETATAVYYPPSEPGWHLISMPLWPTYQRSMHVFEYNGGYTSVDTMFPGIGSWYKPTGPIPAFVGEPTYQDSIPVRYRWNIVGSISAPIPVASITSVPETLRISNFYGYDGSTGYFAADTIQPGQAYWVKARTAGYLLYDTTAPPLAAAKVGIDWLNTLTITDSRGRVKSLHFGTSVPNLERFDLPPLPPQEAFDARFATQRWVEEITTGKHASIMLQGQAPYTVHYSVTGSWQLAGSSITGTGTTTVHQGDVLTLSRGDPTVPLQFALQQNYPNPFNPVTYIVYGIPYTGHVSLKVYNVLGQVVATLADEVQEAGTHEVTWDASASPSGVYYYRLQAGTNIATQKMILLR